MRLHNVLILCTLALGLMITSCKSDDAPVPIGTFTCEIDGTEYTADGLTVTAPTVNGETQLTLSATKLSGATFAFTVYKFTGEGDYALGEGNTGNGILPNNAIYTAMLGGATQFGSAVPGGTGTLTVSKYDNATIEASFEFVGADNDGNKVTITKGKFSANVN